MIPVLAVSGLKKSFQREADVLSVLDNFSFELKKGESFVVFGPSGTGKSVLLKCLLGLISHDEGEIYLEGQSVSSMNEQERRKAFSSFGMLFQSSALFDSLTILDNIAFPLIVGKRMEKHKAYEIALKKMQLVDLDASVAQSYPSELSGGMQKRASLARTLAAEPKVIFFDEPTVGLDPVTAERVNELIFRCVQDLGVSAITVTHDIRTLKHIGDRAGLLWNGSFQWVGPVKGIDDVSDPYVFQFIRGLLEGPFQK